MALWNQATWNSSDLWGGNTLAIPVEIPTGEVALRLREKVARVFNLWAWE